jgi:hypothetical protein
MMDPREAGLRGNGAGPVLSPREAHAAHEFIGRVRRHVPAELEHVLLFGSKARRTARPDSDLDLLLIFRALPPDREPQATIAEEIADEVAAFEEVPVAPWSVALLDLQRGMRTPMLVDALEDGIALWPHEVPPPRLPFTPEDALRCTAALLQRVEEGSEEVARRLGSGDLAGAVRRGRDDVVRLCTAALLLHGETRPRRARAVRRFIEGDLLSRRCPVRFLPVLQWAADSFGPEGKDEERPVPPPPGGFPEVVGLVEQLRSRVALGRHRLAVRVGVNGNSRPPVA